MNVLVTINSLYIDMMKDMLFSLKKNNNNLKIYLFYEDLSSTEIDDLFKYFESENIGDLYPIYFDSSNLKLPLNVSHISRETYFRLYAPFFLPNEIDRILFLDVDLICTKCIEDFYNTLFDENIFVACENLDSNNYKFNRRLGLPDDNVYINAGVLLINLELYRSFINIDELNKFIKDNYDILMFHDQDIINKLFNKYIKYADIKYNYQINMIMKNNNDSNIVHYASSKKPWFLDYDTPHLANDFYLMLKEKKDFLRLDSLKNRHHENYKKSLGKGRIDVIIPAYNSHNTIEQTICSLVSQSFSSYIDVLIVNDNSKYSYFEIINKYSNLIRINEVSNLENVGPGRSRQIGLFNSYNEYIVFMDSDDIFYSYDAIEKLYNKIKSTNSDMVVSNFEEELPNIKLLHSNSFVWLHGKMFRRSFIEENNIEFNNSYQNEDNGFNQLCLLCQPKISYLDKITYVWKYNKNSITRKNNREFTFTGLEGYCYNMAWSLMEAKKRDCANKVIANRCFSNYIYIYYKYLENSDDNKRKLLLKWVYDLGILYEEYKVYLSKESINNILKNYFKESNFDESVMLPNITFNEFHEKVLMINK